MKAVGARLIAGRDISPDDRLDAPSVAVVNQAFAKFYFCRCESGWRTIFFDANSPTTIVGVVGDVWDHTLAVVPERRAYAPYVQQVNGKDDPGRSCSKYARVATRPQSFRPSGARSRTSTRSSW